MAGPVDRGRFILRPETLNKDREGGQSAMWRPNIEVVEKNFKNENEMDRGTNCVARQ
jgi:hypothetical protein